VAESVNAALKGAFVSLSRGFFRVMGQTKATVLLGFTLVLGFTLAGFNLDRVSSFLAKHRLGGRHGSIEDSSARRYRSKRRRGTWTDLLANERDRASPG
jgi:hypothetical protein